MGVQSATVGEEDEFCRVAKANAARGYEVAWIVGGDGDLSRLSGRAASVSTPCAPAAS